MPKRQPSKETSAHPLDPKIVPQKRPSIRLESPAKTQKGNASEKRMNEWEQTQEVEEAGEEQEAEKEAGDEVKIKEEPVDEEWIWNSMAGIGDFPVVEPEEMILSEGAGGEDWTEEQRAAGGF